MPQLKGKSGRRRVEAISNCYKVEGHLEVMEATVEKQFDPVPCQRPSEITNWQNLLWDLGSRPKITLLLENITEAEMCFHMGGN